MAERRSRLELDLGEVRAPVLRHGWGLLLPEEMRYRYVTGDLGRVVARLQPAQLPEREPSRSGRKSDSSVLGPGGPSGIRARVMDEMGGVLPGATVTLSNDHTGWTAVATANAEGRIWFASLPTGRYSLAAELAGFATATYEAIPLEYGETPASAIPLHISGIEETVTVTDETPLIDTRTAGITTTFGGGRASRGSGRSRTRALEPDQEALYRGEANDLRRGLARGVKPVPVTIPEHGKLIELAGALPPATVRVALEVKR